MSSGACSGHSAGISMSWNGEPTWPLRAGSKADGWTRSTSDKSPVRESRTPGSAGEVPRNRHLYPTAGKHPGARQRFCRKVSEGMNETRRRGLDYPASE